MQPDYSIVINLSVIMFHDFVTFILLYIRYYTFASKNHKNMKCNDFSLGGRTKHYNIPTNLIFYLQFSVTNITVALSQYIINTITCNNRL